MGRCCFWGLSAPEPGCCFRFARVVPFVPFMVVVLKLSLEVVLIALLFADRLEEAKVNDSNLEGRRMEG
jgi:hypothetical protein